MKFKYNAKTKTGELQTGFVDAVSRDVASNILLSHELYILSLESTEVVRWYEYILSVFKRVRLPDLMVFTRQFATLLDAKISLGDSLKNLYRQTRNSILKEAIFEISSDVDSGLSLSQALERQSKIFSNFYVSMVRSAEVTGRMEEAIKFMADYLEKEATLVSKVQNALIYPALVFGLLIVVAGIVVGFVFPQIEPIFKESNASIPLVTQILLGMGSFMGQWWYAILLILAAVIAIIWDYFRSGEGKIVFDELLINTPVLGNLFKKLYVARFAEATSVLIKGGIPVAQALEISGHTVGSIIYRDAIHEIAESVREGKLFSQSLQENEEQFPPLVGQMVAVGESTGKLDELLSRTAAFYSREVEDMLNNLVELVQPLIMIIMGISVGLLFASVLLPIYNLVQTF
ncbi:MAG: Uncharacterized protein Athens071426_160 [Parcubacteria group bacterium Athens0714_26]|nr:MAG: Uncharacterized protein Athens101426_266 [Parcubacteria group bacterium Athens1014_26]TSD03616.1 MAG: Uncharacterized protein Athens071426_160 [Parcubacteria group bacterium Athens0714_26]